MDYYKLWECPRCDAEIYQKGWNGHEKNGIPVFDTMMFEQEYINCDKEIYRHYDNESDWISVGDWKKLEEEEQDKYYSDECGCEFGTGDIEIIEA